jgi:hypothetical protein
VTQTVRIRAHQYAQGPRLRLTRGLRISGQVSDSDGNPVSVDGVHVFAAGASASASAQVERLHGYQVRTDSSGPGGFRVVGLAPSPSGYYVCASTVRSADQPGFPGSGCFRHGTWTGGTGDQPVGAEPVKIKNGSYRTAVDFRLPQSGSISGTVTSVGWPVQTEVDVYGTDGHELTRTDSSSDGSYIFNSLSPGSYYVCAGPPPTDRSDNGSCYKDVVLPPGWIPYALDVSTNERR